MSTSKLPLLHQLVGKSVSVCVILSEHPQMSLYLHPGDGPELRDLALAIDFTAAQARELHELLTQAISVLTFVESGNGSLEDYYAARSRVERGRTLATAPAPAPSRTGDGSADGRQSP
jgi:hypothetical protein